MVDATENAALETLVALSATPTPTPTPSVTPTPTPTLEPVPAALAAWEASDKTNDDWTPVIETFDGVEMVLVPPGCFMMGSDDGEFDERPVHEICFDAPFWIDRYEVTNEQYGSVGCESMSSDPDQPRDCVTWFEARDFCVARGGRLPTEAEWEYAARGPDSLVYPWGNEYDAALVIGADDPTYGNTRTAPVGSRPNGASWVGALDLSGNVWEWTSSLYEYESYPYDVEDGRENESASPTAGRVVRGGSFASPRYGLRGALRTNLYPPNSLVYHGFRCVRPEGE
jgi:formylglycine-generating enzyme required for sulfatase activity